MATIDLTETLDRIVLIEKEALAALTPSVTAVDAVPRFIHWQNAWPYWTNRIINGFYGDDGEELDEDNYTLVARLIIGHILEGYEGQPENDLYTYIPQFKTYLHAREGLQTDQASGPDLRDEQDFLIRARCVTTPGFRIFETAGIPVLQVGTEFNILCEFEEDNISAAT